MPERTALSLAALANAAVPGLDPVGVRIEASSVEGVDAAVVEDSLKRRWVVRRPQTTAASAALELESTLLEALSGWLPFATPQVAGTVALDGGLRAVVQRHVPGVALDPGRLIPGPGLCAALGRAIAAVHDLPVKVIEDAGLPVYSAEEFRTRRLAEVDRAAATGMVPPALLARWEHGLEEVGAWRFVPCPVHGDLAADSVLVDGDAVSGILDWSQARVADPADDFAWLAVGAEPDALESVLEAYAQARRSPPDAALARRARLSGELAVARWLLHGIGTRDDAIVADAQAMLAELA